MCSYPITTPFCGEGPSDKVYKMCFNLFFCSPIHDEDILPHGGNLWKNVSHYSALTKYYSWLFYRLLLLSPARHSDWWNTKKLIVRSAIINWPLFLIQCLLVISFLLFANDVQSILHFYGLCLTRFLVFSTTKISNEKWR